MRKILVCTLIAAGIALILCAQAFIRGRNGAHIIDKGDNFCLERVPDGIEIYVPSGRWAAREADVSANISPQYTASIELRPGVTQIKWDTLRDASGRQMDSLIPVNVVGVSFKDDQFMNYAFAWAGGAATSPKCPIACLARTPDGLEAYVPTGLTPGRAQIRVNDAYDDTVDLSTGVTVLARSGFRDLQGQPMPQTTPFLTATVKCMPSGITALVDWTNSK